MTREKKIAWLNVGAIFCGFWAFACTASLVYAIAVVSRDTVPDATGLAFTVGMFLLLCVLPAYFSWKFLKTSNLLARQRRDEFAQKEAFK